MLNLPWKYIYIYTHTANNNTLPPERPDVVFAAGCLHWTEESHCVVTCWLTVWSQQSAWRGQVQEMNKQGQRSVFEIKQMSGNNVTVSWRRGQLTELVWKHPPAAAESCPATRQTQRDQRVSDTAVKAAHLSLNPSCLIFSRGHVTVQLALAHWCLFV